MTQIVKRVSLEGIFDGWDSECFALVRPASVQDKSDFRKAARAVADSIANGKAGDGDIESDMQQKMVDDHFVSGKVKGLNDSGEYELVDLAIDDLQLAEVSDHLYMKLLGIDLDPKDIAAVAAENLKLSGDEKPSETPSSTDSAT